jgi:hypothetical protein
MHSPTRSISTLETKGFNEDTDDFVDQGRVVLRGRGREVRNENLQQEKWTKLISDNKWQVVLRFITISLTDLLN